MARTTGLRLCLVLALCAFLSACSAMQGIGSAVGALGSGGPSVDATAQVGRENTQEGDAVVDNRRVEDRQADAGVRDSGVEVSEVSGVSNVTSSTSTSSSQKETDASSGVSLSELSGTIQALNVNNVPPLFLFLFALGWLLPGPFEIVKGIGSILVFFRKLIVGDSK